MEFCNNATLHLSNENEISDVIRACSKNTKGKIYLACRNEEMAVVLSSILENNSLDFDIYGLNTAFFKSQAYKDVVGFLTLALYPESFYAFEKIYYMPKMYLKHTQMNEIAGLIRLNSMSVYEALERVRKENYQIGLINSFICDMKLIGESETSKAIQILFSNIYGEYFYEKRYRDSIRVAFKALAKRETNLNEFFCFLPKLQELFKEHLIYDIEESKTKIIIANIDAYIEDIEDRSFGIEI